MNIEMIMPQMGESIVEGTIVKWRKSVGEAVQKDEMILEISTDKVDSEIPAPASGRLAAILVAEGQTVAVKTPIALIEQEESGAAAKPAAIAAAEPMAAAEAAVAAAPSVAAPSVAAPSAAAPFVAVPGPAPVAAAGASTLPASAVVDESKRFLSPVVKKIAREYGLSGAELESIQGRGENQRITKQDILDYLGRRGIAAAAPASAPAAMPSPAAPPLRPEVVAAASTQPTAAPQAAPAAAYTSAAAPAPVTPAPAAAPVSPAAASGSDYEVVPMDHVRKRIAEHMIMSKQTSAHVTSVAEADVTAMVQYRERIKKSFEAREGFPITYTAFFIEVVARALKEFPMLNASLERDNILLKKSVHIGIAVGLDDKLIVPVIRNADQLNTVGIARAVSDLAGRARSRQLKPEEVQGGTFSITNIGTFGNLFGTPIISQPQVAILGTGAIKKRPVVINDAIAIRSMMYLSLTYDHRLIDGLYGGRFMQRIVEMLENFKGE